MYSPRFFETYFLFRKKVSKENLLLWVWHNPLCHTFSLYAKTHYSLSRGTAFLKESLAKNLQKWFAKMVKFTQTVFANQSRFLGLLSPKSFGGLGFIGVGSGVPQNAQSKFWGVVGESKPSPLYAFFVILSWRQERMKKYAYLKIFCIINLPLTAPFRAELL